MIIDKRPLPDDPMPSDAPPSYEATNERFSSEKSNKLFGYSSDALSPTASTSQSYSPPVAGPSSPTSSNRSYSQVSSPTSPLRSDKGKARAVNNWFNFAANRTNREVRTTVLGLVRDLVQEHISGSPAAIGILKSCADACNTHEVSLSEILQTKFIEEHTPFYWAIVKRLPDGHQDIEDSQGPDLLSALISYASPLNRDTIREIRLACLATSDQKLFQRLRLSPDFHAVSGVEQMLLGVRLPLDEVEVADVSPDGGAFAMDFVVPHFHKRMVVSKEIDLEFIARGRMWKLAFYIAPPPKWHSDPVEGSWCISISLLENSPPTFLDSQILIRVVPETAASPLPSPSQLVTQGESPSTLPPTSPLSQFSSALLSSTRPSRPDPTISLRLKTSHEQLEAPGKRTPGKNVMVTLETSLLASKLQYSNNPYIGPDEKLRGRLEARLGKPEADCIIC
ncbi:hypothetical protein CPB83DRAFT_773328 [Crepidotus variabilis]|uniref:Uncharacterized protein n=1 Tax=Crepidotus variabilis TaxID=179855 RepID=A0A9P6JLJ3_9AGAR|nr:hypothetical protein CPB83DRAFT_773328 [Crepidotus variabilis]